jgi:hypothetical protein
MAGFNVIESPGQISDKGGKVTEIFFDGETNTEAVPTQLFLSVKVIIYEVSVNGITFMK